MNLKFLLCIGAIFAINGVAADITEYFPTNPGGIFRYEVVKERKYVLPNGALEEKVRGHSNEFFERYRDDDPKIENSWLMRQEIEENNERTWKTSKTVMSSILTLADETVLIRAQKSEAAAPPLKADWSWFQPPVVLIDFQKINNGAPYETKMTIQDMKIHSKSIEYKYVAKETKLGKLESVLWIKEEGTISGSTGDIDLSDGTIETESWYAPGVGLVEQISTTRMTMTPPNGANIQLTEKKTKRIDERRQAKNK